MTTEVTKITNVIPDSVGLFFQSLEKKVKQTTPKIHVFEVLFTCRLIFSVLPVG